MITATTKQAFCRIVSRCSAFLTAAYVVPHVHAAVAPLVGDAGWGDLTSPVLLALAAMVPSLLACLGWRMHRRRFLAE